MGDTDRDVIRASLDVPERFGEIFERHYLSLDSYCVRRLGGEGHDVSAATFVAAFHGRAGFDPARGDVRAWLYGIASNLARRHHRSEARRLRAYARADPAVPVAFDADTRIDAAAAGTRLAQGLRGLPGRDRDALLLFAWADLSYAEIARRARDPDRHRAVTDRTRTGPVAQCPRRPGRDPRAGPLERPETR